MSEREFLCVQEMTIEVADARAELCILDRIVAAAPISLIANDRMFQPRQVNANLVSPPGFQFHIQQRESLKRTSNPIKR